MATPSHLVPAGAGSGHGTSPRRICPTHTRFESGLQWCWQPFPDKGNDFVEIILRDPRHRMASRQMKAADSNRHKIIANGPCSLLIKRRNHRIRHVIVWLGLRRERQNYDTAEEI